MYPLTEMSETALATVATAGVSEIGDLTVTLLSDEDEAEVMAFLAERPSYTFAIAGMIRNNGIVSPHNRGGFYACRNAEGNLLGVALIGHFILFESRSDAATASRFSSAIRDWLVAGGSAHAEVEPREGTDVTVLFASSDAVLSALRSAM